MSFIFLQAGLAKAICWMLIHSLWQGALAAVLAGVIVLATRRSAPRIRYYLLGGVMLLFLFATVLTFLHMLTAPGTADRPLAIQVSNDAATAAILVDDATAQTSTDWVARATAFADRYAGLLVLGWMVFFVFRCTRIAAGLAGVRRLRQHKISAADSWQTRLDQLSALLGIHQSVRLLQSELVKVPVAIGFFKPVILVPLGLLAQLPPEQVETILLHELAHIRRRDYLVNLLQCMAEAVFFFNPALLWISSLIRQEREACCDDIVMANTTQQRSYLDALVSFQEYTMIPSSYAMAIGGKQHYLLNRVKRMLTRENKKLNLMEKLLLVAGLTTIMAFTFIPREETAVPEKPVSMTADQPVTSSQPVVPVAVVTSRKPAEVKKTTAAIIPSGKAIGVKLQVADTLPQTNNRYEGLRFPSVSSTINDDGTTRTETMSLTDQNGKIYTVARQNGKVTNLTVDGKTVPPTEINDYSSLLQQIEFAVHNREMNMQLKMKQRQADALKRQMHLESRMDSTRLIREKTRNIADQKRQLQTKNRMDSVRRKMDVDRKVRDRKQKEDNQKRQELFHEKRKQMNEQIKKIKDERRQKTVDSLRSYSGTSMSLFSQVNGEEKKIELFENNRQVLLSHKVSRDLVEPRRRSEK